MAAAGGVERQEAAAGDTAFERQDDAFAKSAHALCAVIQCPPHCFGPPAMAIVT